MINTNRIDQLFDTTVVDRDGDKIGTIKQVYLGDQDGQPHFASVNTGRRDVGHDTSGPTTDDAMTRSEEHLNVGKQTEHVGRARLRKYVVTEHQTVNVPVQHEEVRVEREPITDANAADALDGPPISEEEHEVTLKAERAVVDKEAVPVERVRLDKETVTEEQQVGEDVRREEVVLEDDSDPNHREGR